MKDFRQSLRRDLLQALEAQRVRRVRYAISGLTAATVMLTTALAVFVLTPSIPASLNAGLFGEPVREQHSPGLTDVSAGADRAWIEAWYDGHPEPALVKSMEAEQLFAVRRFELTSGKRVIVFTEIGEEQRVRPARPMAAVRDF